MASETATSSSSSSAATAAEGQASLAVLLALLEDGQEEYRPLWDEHDTFDRGGLTAPQFAAFWHAFCQREGLAVDLAEVHSVFRQLDPDGSGSLCWRDVVGGPAHRRPPHRTVNRWMTLQGRKLLGDPTKGPAAVLPIVEWAPFPQDGRGRYQFCPRAALAVWHVGTTVAHHLFFHKPFQPPSDATLHGCLYAYPNMLEFGSKKKAKEDSTFIGAALETPFAFVLYLRGTCLLSEVFADMKVVLKSCPGLPGAVHAGFYAVYTRGPCLRLQIKQALEAFAARDPHKPIVLGGHSLGAGLMMMATYEALAWIPTACHRLVLLTFGGPKIGNKAWAEAFDRDIPRAGATAWRVANTCDPVTKLGFRPLFHHCGEAREFRLRLASPVGKGWLKNHVEAYPTWLEGPTQAASRCSTDTGTADHEGPTEEFPGSRMESKKIISWRKLVMRK
eukprot:EG_transcript_11166